MPKQKHRRTVVMEVRLPVAVRFTVEATTDDEIDIDCADWDVVGVEDADNFAKASSVAQVCEAMDECDFEEMARRARAAAK